LPLRWNGEIVFHPGAMLILSGKEVRTPLLPTETLREPALIQPMTQLLRFFAVAVALLKKRFNFGDTFNIVRGRSTCMVCRFWNGVTSMQLRFIIICKRKYASLEYVSQYAVAKTNNRIRTCSMTVLLSMSGCCTILYRSNQFGLPRL
jgi:hypothetical protein